MRKARVHHAARRRGGGMAARGARAAKRARATIGASANLSPASVPELMSALREGLRERGYVQGQNLTLSTAGLRK